MSILEAISAKRDGRANTDAQLCLIADGASDGSIPDYQLSAWLMAVFLNGMDDRETADLTMAMAESGERMALDGLPKPWVDKHSTGGVGDKTTLVLLPLLAACGLTVIKMSGRGLGITGGTIDKLESVPGFRIDLSPEEMKEQAREIGLALTGQTPRLAPADKVLYGLRDVTGTVACLPLIISSILSKKIAGGAEHVVFDVKCGSGCFMKTLPEAEELRTGLVEVGQKAGLKVRAAITDMDQPLGHTAGNALEVKEAIRVLKGEPGRVHDLVVHLAGLALESCGAGDKADAASALDSGLALAKARAWFKAQGGDTTVFDSEDWQTAPCIRIIESPAAGYVSKIDSQAVGKLVIRLGGGRKQKSDVLDPTVGVELHVEIGDKVEVGQPLAAIHSSSKIEFEPFIQIAESPVEPAPIILA
jgi:pyrimidine-nucleoside phosphorylase